MNRPRSAGLHSASATFDGQVLHATTGAISLAWEWTGHGCLTTRTTTPDDGAWKLDKSHDCHADWLIPTVEGNNPPATLVKTELQESDDNGFTSPHLSFCSEMEYPDGWGTVTEKARDADIKLGFWMAALPPAVSGSSPIPV